MQTVTRHRLRPNVPGGSRPFRGEAAGLYLLVETTHGDAGFESLAQEYLRELCVLPEGQVAPSFAGIQAHQRRVRLLVQGFGRDGLFQRFRRCHGIAALAVEGGDPDEQRQVRFPQRRPPVFGPRLVKVLGQEVPGVEIYRRSMGGRVSGPFGHRRGLLEGLRVYPQG